MVIIVTKNENFPHKRELIDLLIGQKKLKL